MALEKVKKQNISDIVFQQLEQNILTGEWPRGTKIPSENTLASQLGVSRVTVRNALQRLSSIGLIEAKQGGGTYVRMLPEGETLELIKPILAQTKPDVKFFLEYRLAIEPEMAALAAERATPDQLERMQKYLTQYEQAVSSGDKDAIFFNDSQLHYAIATASANPLIIKTYGIIKDIYSLSLAKIVMDLGPEAGIAFHRKIVEAILLRDISGAREAMRAHLTETIRLSYIFNTAPSAPDVANLA